jgi:GT2 family glycosyltransferase
MVFADDDCMAPPNWIEKMVYFHRQYPHIAVIQGQVVNYYGNNLIAALEQRINEAYLDYIVYEENNHRYITLFSTGNCSLKKEVFKKKGMAFKERLLVYGDVDLSNQLTEKGVKILYAEEITVMHKYRTNLPDFIKRHVRDGRWRYVLRVIWHKTERDYNTKKFSPPKFFLKMSLGYVRDYKIRGIILIVLHAVRKLARVSGYLYQKMFSPNELYNKKIRTHR